MASKVLVLNQDYQAISVCTAERAFILVLLQKAEMVCDRKAKVLRSIGAEFRYPSIIRLNRYINLPYKKVALSRQNIFKRDGYRCVYCGSREHLTLDHVIPRSLGGQTRWDNVVAACSPCNLAKANKLPKDCGMHPHQKAYRPTVYELHRNGRKFPPNYLHESWLDYLYWDTELEP
ncbi:MAG: HNH endonuclease [Bacteroidota bacterium]